MGEITLGNLYDFNKQAMTREEPLDAILLNRATEELVNHMRKYKYTMLLCRERNDYTIFFNNTHKYEQAIKEVRETLMNRGLILAIDLQDDGAYEIWIRDIDTGENFVYYLFDYSNAVVEI